MVENAYFNALALAHGGDYKKLAGLLAVHTSWRAAWMRTKPMSETRTGTAFDALTTAGISLVLAGEEAFPPLLKEMPWPPHALYVRGAPLEHDRPAIAIVGTRRASPAGKDLARRFASQLAARGITIISGLALGMDAAAHAGALEAGGKTIAVLAGGVNRIYPPQNDRLGKEILERGGSIISEYPLDMPTYPSRFIERNRIVSGLSRGVIVIEAPERSGALATARFALDQNRDVFVVPGPLASSLYAGSHALIKSGAALVTDTADILDALDLADVPGVAAHPAHLDAAEQAVFNTLQAAAGPLGADAIAATCALPIETVSRTLGLLAVRGAVSERGGNYVIA